MNKKSTFSIMTLMLFFVVACSTAGRDIKLVDECYYSDREEAPEWTCNSSAVIKYNQLSDVTWVVGEAKKIPAGKSLQKKAAVLNARAKLLERIAVLVRSSLKKITQSQQAEEQIDSFVESFAEGVLTGTVIYKTATDNNNGDVFVMLGITNTQFKKNIDNNPKYKKLRQAFLGNNGGNKTAKTIDDNLSEISQIRRVVGN